MSTLITNKDVRLIQAGIKVSRPAATLPQTATGSIFTVTGGRIIIKAIIGEVTVALGATATNLNLVYTPAGGAAADISAATVCTSDAVGTLYSISGVATDLLSAQTVAGTEVPNVTFAQVAKFPIVVDAGAVGLKASAGDTGSVKWDLVYVPLDDGAQVVAA